MRQIIVENIKWQRRDVVNAPGLVWMPLEDDEAKERGLPQLEIVEVPDGLAEEDESSFIIQHLESEHYYKVSSFCVPIEKIPEVYI